jgi:pyruvate/2-oxoacid:ferredoxin oxidoreductase alpha subunit
MTADPRAALEQLIAALERHLEAAKASRDPDHPMVMAAAQDLAEAFDDYDEALYEATEVATPLAIYGDDFDGHEDEDGTENHVYAGLDSDEYDEDDDEDDEDDDDEDDDEDDDDDYEDEDDDLDGGVTGPTGSADPADPADSARATGATGSTRATGR